MKVYTYYENINFKHQDRLLDLWKISWENRGFESIILGRKDAENHPMYEFFTEGVKTINQKIANKPLNSYGLSCWIRWLAYAEQTEEKFYVCDYDVINHSFFPKEPDDMLHLMDCDCPCIASGTPHQFNELCNKFIEIPNKYIEQFIRIYNEKNFRHYHDQEFFRIIHEINNWECDIKKTRERKFFFSSPDRKDFWKRQVIHYSHDASQKYLKELNTPFSEEERCNIIEEHINKK